MIENILDFNLKCKLISLTFNKSSLSWKLLNGVRGYWDQCLIHSFSTSRDYIMFVLLLLISSGRI